MNTETKKPVIRWTANERVKFEKEFERIANNLPTGTSMVEVARRAQLILPEHRHRNIIHMGVFVPDDRKRLAALYEAGSVPHVAAPAQQQPVPEPQPTKSDITRHLTEDALALSIERLAGVMVERILTAVRTQLHTRLHEVIVQETVAQRAPRVLVLGPKPDQQRILEDEFAGVLNLRFLSSEELRRAVSLAKHYEHVVVWTNFVSHAHTDPIPNKILVTGGVNAIRDKLLEIFAGTEA